MTVELIKALYSDLWTLLLTFIGVLLSILTLFYSFVLGKRDELKIINEMIKAGDKSPLTLQRKTFSIKYIKRLKKINSKCFYALLLSILAAIFCWIGMRVLFSNWMFHLVIILTAIIIGYLIILGIEVVKQYNSETAI